MKIPPIFLVTLCSVLLCTSWAQAQTTLLTVAPLTPNYNDGKSILDTTSETQNLKHLFTALKAAELESLLEQEGPFTFFTPNNDAFEQISETQWESLFLKENRPKLKAILSNHIVAGHLSASKILLELCKGGGQASFTTLHGTKIKALFLDSEIVIKDSIGNYAKITKADMSQSNGIIHQIDNLILPSGL